MKRPVLFSVLFMRAPIFMPDSDRALSSCDSILRCLLTWQMCVKKLVYVQEAGMMMGMGMMGMPPHLMGMGPGMMGAPPRPGIMGPPMPPGGALLTTCRTPSAACSRPLSTLCMTFWIQACNRL